MGSSAASYPGRRSLSVSDDAGAMPDQQLYRLFVGWVPTTYSEANLQPLFSQWGTVKDIKILQDKSTGRPLGCAFVLYSTKAEAELAIAEMDHRVHLPDAPHPLEVRFSRNYRFVSAGTGPEDNRQLFFNRISPSATEDQVRTIFAQFGEVEDLELFKDRDTGRTRGSGLVTMQTRQQAIAALEELDEWHTMAGAAAPLSIKWADPELQSKKRRAQQKSNIEHRGLFFSHISPSATEEEVKGLFSRHGHVLQVTLSRPHQGSAINKGYGLVTMDLPTEAVAAMEALDNQHVWPGMNQPMSVTFLDRGMRRMQRQQQDLSLFSATRTHSVPAMMPNVPMPLPMLPYQQMHMSLSSMGSMGHPPHPGHPLGMGHTLIPDLRGASPGSPTQVPLRPPALLSPPPGCAPDAVKLFVGNIPRRYCSEDLLPFFGQVGQVVEVAVIRHTKTRESKGSAFVWYATRAMAEQAIARFNLRAALPDPEGNPERLLEVRVAEASTAAITGAPGALGTGLGGSMAVSSLSRGSSLSAGLGGLVRSSRIFGIGPSSK